VTWRGLSPVPMALAGPQEIDESPRVFGRDVAVALVPVPMGPRRRTELHENPCAIDVAQALRPAASRLFGPLLAASRAGAREGAFEAAASALSWGGLPGVYSADTAV